VDQRRLRDWFNTRVILECGFQGMQAAGREISAIIVEQVQDGNEVVLEQELEEGRADDEDEQVTENPDVDPRQQEPNKPIENQTKPIEKRKETTDESRVKEKKFNMSPSEHLGTESVKEECVYNTKVEVDLNEESAEMKENTNSTVDKHLEQNETIKTNGNVDTINHNEGSENNDDKLNNKPEQKEGKVIEENAGSKFKENSYQNIVGNKEVSDRDENLDKNVKEGTVSNNLKTALTNIIFDTPNEGKENHTDETQTDHVKDVCIQTNVEARKRKHVGTGVKEEQSDILNDEGSNRNNELEQPTKKKRVEPSDKINSTEDKVELRADPYDELMEEETNITNAIGEVEVKKEVEKDGQMFHMEEGNREKESNVGENLGTDTVMVKSAEAAHDNFGKPNGIFQRNLVQAENEVDSKKAKLDYSINISENRKIGSKQGILAVSSNESGDAGSTVTRGNHGIEVDDREEQIQGIQNEGEIYVDKKDTILNIVSDNVNTEEATVQNTDEKNLTEKSEKVFIKYEDGSEETVKEKETVNTKDQGTRKFKDVDGSEERLKEENGNSGEESNGKSKPMKVDRKEKNVGKEWKWSPKCPDCVYVTGVSRDMILHLLRHTGEKPHKCDQCSYASTTPANLQNHVNSKHTKEKPHACKQCNEKFSSPSARLQHFKREHEKTVKTHKCDTCDYSCAQAKAMQTHKRKHTGEKTLQVSQVH